jgi:Uma2 family endonuclease
MANRTTAAPKPICYPMSDGKPIADNTLQFDWILKLFNDLAIQYADTLDVFLASNLIWYPVEGRPKIRTAPDVMVALGRPKGYRSSYLQWLEDGIPPQVVFEIRSPRNRPLQLQRMFEFYQKYGVEEYYFYDPYKFVLKAWRRAGRRLKAVRRVNGLKSPRLSVRFELTDDGLHVFGSDGLEFVSPEQQSKRAEAEKEQLRQSRDLERARYETLLRQLHARGIDPDEL